MVTFQERYRACKEQVKEKSKETPNKVWIALASIFLSILIMVGPIVILINCIIFNDFMNLVVIGVLLCIYMIVFLSRVFYYMTITKKQVEDMKCFYLVDAGVCALVLCVGLFLGLFI